MTAERILALTSLPPRTHDAARQRACIQSWHQAGMEVYSFNHPAEIEVLSGHFDVNFVSVTDTTSSVFGRHYIPINAMLNFAHCESMPAMLINADIDLAISPWQLKRARWLSDGGMCYFIRHNYSVDPRRGVREPYGIDAFLLHGRDSRLFPESFLSMGQPYWDYWLPHTFAANDRPLVCVDHPLAFHHNHPRNWSWSNWHLCAIEFDRMHRLLGNNQSLQACLDVAARVRHAFDKRAVRLSPQPFEIRSWVERHFASPGPKTFLELGAHRGEDTAWMSRLPGVTIYAFEPDPRNQPPALPNVVLTRAAIASADGHGPFITSDVGWGREWTYSSSIKQPKNHLQRYPVTFGKSIDVQMTTLDTFCGAHGFANIDFIWADIQGAEGDMIQGGTRTLNSTRYLYTEYSDDELYEGQASLKDITDMLPDFRVLELWQDDVLLENTRLSR
jgi:FkbM family methyltransferase